MTFVSTGRCVMILLVSVKWHEGPHREIHRRAQSCYQDQNDKNYSHDVRVDVESFAYSARDPRNFAIRRAAAKTQGSWFAFRMDHFVCDDVFIHGLDTKYFGSLSGIGTNPQKVRIP
jgi:hypothetical protein